MIILTANQENVAVTSWWRDWVVCTINWIPPLMFNVRCATLNHLVANDEKIHVDHVPFLVVSLREKISRDNWLFFRKERKEDQISFFSDGLDFEKRLTGFVYWIDCSLTTNFFIHFLTSLKYGNPSFWCFPHLVIKTFHSWNLHKNFHTWI